MADDQKDFEEKIKKLNARLKDKNSNINTKRSVAEFLNRFTFEGEGGQSDGGIELGGKVGYRQPLSKTSDLEIGASGHYDTGKGKRRLDRADATYTKRLKDDAELRARLGANFDEREGKRGLDKFMLEYEKSFKKGGKVKAKAKKTNKPKVRGHGCEKKGKTKGRFV
jgi:hypothetical protein